MSDRISDAIWGLQGEAESLSSIQMAEFLQNEFDRLRAELEAEQRVVAFYKGKSKRAYDFKNTAKRAYQAMDQLMGEAVGGAPVQNWALVNETMIELSQIADSEKED